jgi:hypothetical protein
MRRIGVAGFLGIVLAAWGSAANAQAPYSPQTPSQIEQAPPADRDKDVITVPAGTRVALWLTNSISTKWARKGDSVRAVTAFPVAAGGQIVIPTGTYVEGQLEKVTKRGPSGPAGLQIRFTRMVFQSGYAVALDGATAQARAERSSGASVPGGGAASGSQSASGYAMANQQTPGLTPPPMPGPNLAVITGVTVGVMAATVVGGILWARHRSHEIVFDTGYQFDMVLQNPMALDTGSVGVVPPTN